MIITEINKGDLPDSSKDKAQLKPEETTLDLPEIQDIPGQENVKPPESAGAEQLEIASDDEEGADVLDENVMEPLKTEGTSNVTQRERQQLRDAEEMSTSDDRDLRNATLDNEDFDGEPLNESLRKDGKDLDVPGQEMDDEQEAKGAEDEENNEYSIDNN